MNVSVSRKEPSSKGVSGGPNITAFHTMILSGFGLPEIPTGASDAKRLKSRISRLLAAVDMVFKRALANGLR